LTPADAVDGPGWTASVPFSGAASGRMVVWLDAASARAYTRRVLAEDADPADDAVSAAICALLARAAGVVESAPEGAGLMAGDPAAGAGEAPAGSEAHSATFDDGLVVTFGVHVELQPSAVTPPVSRGLADSRLEAVLEVDLPLIVRFGRAVMTMRSVADLSPGAVVDMGRTPDEPVELLVGERLVARGEVVIVGGNYGVRVTEL